MDMIFELISNFFGIEPLGLQLSVDFVFLAAMSMLSLGEVG